MTQWDDQALQARIKTAGQDRYAAGSPDEREVATYRAALLRTLRGEARDRRVLILGMTPELRRLSADLGCATVCVDINPRSIAVYRDWLAPVQRTRETVIQGDWLQLARLLPRPFDAVLGDGLFGNLLTLEAHRRLLATMRDCLVPGGAVIQRNIFIPRDFDLRAHDAEALLCAHRSGSINDEEFGFGMRMWGCHAAAYDPATLLLDNKRVYDTYQSWLDDGRLTPAEHALIRRYYFAGHNLIPGEALWERLLTEAGFRFERLPLAGQQWYGYYPVYSCRRED
ncbi:MAG: class I SAM-dependent methyltransferase [Gammaproteobacteria bacterium]|nr:class I SAM-dependent methyltransferase [Gammaproteobacteria bacterium]